MSYLIKQCRILDNPHPVDVHLQGELIAEIAPDLAATNEDEVIEARGGLLLPGLHDHHIHLVSLAASLASTQCGPPKIGNEHQLAALLVQKNNEGESGWLRGIGYHASVAGDIDRHWLDRYISARPARIQHRGGRLWILNSLGMEEIGLVGSHRNNNLPAGIEFQGNEPTGRLYECDRWLRAQLNSGFPTLAAASKLLASYGITGLTDATPANGIAEWDFFQQSQADRTLLQTVRMMGSANLPRDQDSPKLQTGEFKIHLLESQLPNIDALTESITAAHRSGRNVAIHCVTNTELVYSLSCLDNAGVLPGDRIEHASVTTPEMLEKIAELGLRVVTQPHFIAERGEQYLREVESADQQWLYRLLSFIEAGVPLAAGSDSPFGSPNPWLSMQAAVVRKAGTNKFIGIEEALTPDMALALYTSMPDQPGLQQKELTVGASASLCLLNAPWETVKLDFTNAMVSATWSAGRLIFRRA